MATRDINNPAGEATAGRLRNAILIAGPTASGKSALALDLAQREGGVIVNADSMQVYSVLRVLTARPGEEELAAAPHRLYGNVDPREAYSTGRWLRDVERLAACGEFEHLRPIFVGGTGLYFSALLEGLAAIPEVPEPVRTRWRERLAREGPEPLHALLAQGDPKAAEMIRISDGQRIVRALEVLDASGHPISRWQEDRGRPLVDPATATMLVLEPDRAVLKERIDRRFDAMVGQGALEEAKALAAMNVDPAKPAMKAIGVRELLCAERGEVTLDQAIEKVKIATRQYAKRQGTWFRNQLGPEWTRIGPETAR